MKIKMRTLGRQHLILKRLEDGEPRRRCDIDMATFSGGAKHLENLLKRGLVERLDKDTRKHSWYIITKQGKEVFDKLEELQPYPEEFTDEQVTIRFRARRLDDDGNIVETNEWHTLAGRADVAHRGYKWITIEYEESTYWVDYFSNITW